MSEIKNKWKKWLYWFLLGVAIILAYKIINSFNNIIGTIGKFFTILSPFFAGILIAYLLYMPCKRMERSCRKSKNKYIRKKARAIGVFTVYLIFILLIIILINVIIPVLKESIIDLLNNLQTYIEIAINRYNKLPEDSILKGELVKDTIKNIQNIDIKQYFQLDKIKEYVIGAANVVSGVFNVFVSLIVSIYILMERGEILNFLKKLANATLKEKTYQNLDKYFNNSNEIFFKFIVSQFLDAVIVGILVTIAMAIMKIKYAPLLGFMIGIFNMIPYIGAIIAIVIAAIITLITGGLSQAIWMLVMVTVLQQLDANIINPKIVGQSLKISPLLVIFAITVGGAYFGILGMFLAVPIIAVIKIVVEDYVNMKIEQKRNIEENIEE